MKQQSALKWNASLQFFLVGINVWMFDVVINFDVSFMLMHSIGMHGAASCLDDTAISSYPYCRSNSMFVQCSVIPMLDLLPFCRLIVAGLTVGKNHLTFYFQ